MSHRKCCRRKFDRCGCGFEGGFGNNWICWIIVAILICNCNGGRRWC